MFRAPLALAALLAGLVSVSWLHAAPSARPARLAPYAAAGEDGARPALFPPDSGVFDVKALYGAKGDGVTDDTAAIRKAIFEARNKFRILYFPAGTYLVSDKLSFGDDENDTKAIVLQGESRDRSVIRLADHSAGYGDPAHRKPLLTMYEGGSTSNAFHNGAYDLTFDVGAGNPGAIALQWMNNNQGAMHDIRLVSSDPGRRGAVGLDLTRRWPGPAFFKNIEIVGFDYGIDIDHTTYSVTLEHIDLRDQRVAGVRNTDNVVSIRGLRSHNRVPALLATRRAGLFTLLDAELRGGAPGVPAIENAGHLYLRDVSAEGYSLLVRDRTGALADLPGPRAGEYVSHGAQMLFATEPGMLKLPVEETPTVPWDPPSEWVPVVIKNPKNPGADIQAAFDRAAKEGRTTVYFPGGKPARHYKIDRTIRIHGSVRRVFGLESNLHVVEPLLGTEQSVFVIEDLAADHLVIERFWTTPWASEIKGPKFRWFENRTQKPLVLKNLMVNGGRIYDTAPGGSGKLFIEDLVANFMNLGPKQQPAYFRQFNPESRADMVLNDGGVLWILGLKTEGYGVIVNTRNGGKTEIVGGLVYPAWAPPPEHTSPSPYVPAFVNQDSDVSAIYASEAWKRSWNYMDLAREIHGDSPARNLELEKADVGGRGNALTLPLYVGRRGADPARNVVSAEPALREIREDAPAAPFTFRRTGDLSRPLTVRYRLVGDAAPRFAAAPLPPVSFAAGADTTTLELPLVRDPASTGDRRLSLVLEQGPDHAAHTRPATLTLIDADAPALGSGTGLLAEYFPGEDFDGTPVSRLEPGLSHLWRAGSPAPGIPADGFTARFTGRLIPLYSEDHRFSSWADDGLRLWLDDQLVLDAWRGSDVNRSAPLRLEADRPYAIRVEYVERHGSAGFRLFWTSPSLARLWPDPLPVGDAKPGPLSRAAASLGESPQKLFIPTSQLVPAPAPLAIVRAAVLDAETTEGSDRPLRFRLTREGPADQPLAVRFDLAGDAVNGLDYPRVATEFIFAPGALTHDLTLAPAKDGRLEGRESVVLTVVPSPSYTAAETPATARILDLDAPAGTGLGTGLRASYFAGEKLPGNVFAFGRPIATRVDPLIDSPWRDLSPFAPGTTGSTAPMAVVWTGFIEPRYSEDYTLTVALDDGARLWIDGQIVLEHLPWKSGKFSAKAPLVAQRRHAVRLEFYNVADRARCELSWESPSQPAEFIPTSQLYPDDTSLPLVRVEAAHPELAENDVAGLKLRVTREGDTAAPLPVRLALSGTARPAERFRPLPDQVVIPAGETSVSIDLIPIDDAKGQPPETVVVRPALDPAYLVGATGPVPSSTVTLLDDEMPAPGDGTGLKAEYFQNPDFTDLRVTRVDEKIDFNWNDQSPVKGKMKPGAFSVRWTGELVPHFSEPHVLRLEAVERGRVTLDGKVVIDWGRKNDSATVTLEKGRRHSLVVEVIEEVPAPPDKPTWGARARLFWSSPTQFAQPVPKSQLHPAP